MATTRKRLLAFCLCLTMLAVCLAQTGILGLAATVSTGTVHGIDPGSVLRVREGPGTLYPKIGELKNGDKVTIHETVKNDKDEIWYRLSKDALMGYASAEFISVDAKYETDEEFEAYLKSQGFPEDYKPALRTLHAKYPKWQFTADHLSMTWAKALEAETEVGRNTIRNPESWKSMEKGAFDWNNRTYVAFDSGGWVAASPALVAYYMDPRNFLTETYVFQFENLHYSPEQNKAGVTAILPDKLDKHADALIASAKKANVSAYHLATRIRLEGTVSNGLALGTVKGYEGYYNFFDIGAYAHSGNGAVTNGAIYAKNHGWNTPEKALDAGAEFIGDKYIARKQDTTYYQKYNLKNTESGLYRHQYMTNTRGAADEGKIRFSRAQESDLKDRVVFSIPVFKEMPDKPAPRPSETGNNNNFLESLTVTAKKLPPVPSSTANGSTTLPSGSTAAGSTAAGTTAGTSAGASAAALTAAPGTSAASTAAASGTQAVFAQPEPEPLQLTPSFDRYVMDYTLQVDPDVTEITVTPVKDSEEAKMTGGGTVKITPGDTKIPIELTATSGEKRVYTLTVHRDAPAAVLPSITGTLYKVDSTVTKVEPETTVADFVKNLAVKDGVGKVFAPDGKEKTGGYVGTGDILRLYSGSTVCDSFPVVIYGDVNGDGKIAPVDMLRIQKHIIDIAPLTGYQLTAADINQNGSVQPVDVLRGQKFIVGIYKTVQ